MTILQIQHEKIIALDLEPIAFKLIKAYKWTLDEALLGIKQYRNFLVLISRFANRTDAQGISLVPPNETIDEVWHTHILDTEKYFQDCNDIFGHYIHHFPYSGILTKEDRDVQIDRLIACRELYKSEFGEEVIEIARFEKGNAVECDQCDDCTPGACRKPYAPETESPLRQRPKLSDLEVATF